MADQRSFKNVSPAVWERIKEVGRKAYGTRFDPPDGDRGTARTMTPVGLLELDFALDRETCSITYTVRRKPAFLLTQPLWRGLEDTINSCRREVENV
ncbi:MAG: hypothetical protein MUE49_08675 [Rhodospirillales bacterium]|jgi:hypothetical protein|nr:hypothetical protein [Rhodospirillales bacterium]